VERSEILRVSAQALMGFASAYARWATADEVAVPIQRTGCETLIDNLKEWAFDRDGLGVDGVVDATHVIPRGRNTALRLTSNRMPKD